MKRFDERVKLAANVVSLVLLCCALWPMFKPEIPKILVRVGHRMAKDGQDLVNKGLDMIEVDSK